MDEIFEKFEDFKEIFECFIYKKIERFNNNDDEIFEKLKYSKEMPKYLYIKRSIDFNNNNKFFDYFKILEIFEYFDKIFKIFFYKNLYKSSTI